MSKKKLEEQESAIQQILHMLLSINLDYTWCCEILAMSFVCLINLHAQAAKKNQRLWKEGDDEIYILNVAKIMKMTDFILAEQAKQAKQAKPAKKAKK